MLYPTTQRAKIQRHQRQRKILFDRFQSPIHFPSLWHGRISKCTEPLEGQSIDRRGWRRLDEGGDVIILE